MNLPRRLRLGKALLTMLRIENRACRCENSFLISNPDQMMVCEAQIAEASRLRCGPNLPQLFVSVSQYRGQRFPMAVVKRTTNSVSVGRSFWIDRMSFRGRQKYEHFSIETMNDE
jgi:hypothetical protein